MSIFARPHSGAADDGPRSRSLTKFTTIDFLKQNKVHSAWIGKTEIMAFLHEGNVKVFRSLCPHQGGPLAEGCFDGKTVTCRWHGWKFGLGDGQSTTIPGLRLDAIPTEVVNGDVMIDEKAL